MFIYVFQTPSCFQFTKKKKKKKKLSFGKGLFGRWWLFAGGLWSFADVSWSFSGSLCWFVVVCGCLWLLLVLATTK